VIRRHGNHIAGHLGTPGDIGSAFLSIGNKTDSAKTPAY